MKKISLIQGSAAALLLVSASANAAIIDVETAADMKVSYADANNNYIVDAAASTVGNESASVSVSGAVTGADAYSSLGFSALTAESAVLDFDLGYNGNGYNGSGYMGGGGVTGNYGFVTYDATVDSVLNYSWDFAYAGTNPFGLQIVSILEDGTTLNVLGNSGSVGTHTGNDSFAMLAGNSYTFKVSFIPNVWGGIGNISGDLAGYVSFDFGGPGEVPVPATLPLIALGLLGMAAARKRQQA